MAGLFVENVYSHLFIHRNDLIQVKHVKSMPGIASLRDLVE